MFCTRFHCTPLSANKKYTKTTTTTTTPTIPTTILTTMTVRGRGQRWTSMTTTTTTVTTATTATHTTTRTATTATTATTTLQTNKRQRETTTLVNIGRKSNYTFLDLFIVNLSILTGYRYFIFGVVVAIVVAVGIVETQFLWRRKYATGEGPIWSPVFSRALP